MKLSINKLKFKFLNYECDFFETKTEFGNCGVPRITSLFNQKSFEPKFRTKIQNVIISHADNLVRPYKISYVTTVYAPKPARKIRI